MIQRTQNSKWALPKIGSRFPTFYGYQRFIREAILENIGFPIFDVEDLESFVSSVSHIARIELCILV